MGKVSRIGLVFVLLLMTMLGLVAARAWAQTIHYATRPNTKRGEVVYKGGCIACHGSDGKGAPEYLSVFKRPDTWPDFTQCDQTTPEPDGNWKSVTVYGGRYRGYSQIMPAFGTLLTDEQINDVIAYMRGFCKNVHHYPMGELNLPRALVTEKAFPEDELVVSTAMNATGPASNTTDVIHEETFAGRNQLEVDVPVNYAKPDGNNWTEGVGDITLGLKREIFSSLRTGSILSLQGGVLLPTGDSNRGLGAGTTTFEPFAAFDQLFPENTSFQFQVGADIPVSTQNTPRSIFYRMAVGQSMAREHDLGRLFTPMVELLGKRNFASGASTNLDVLPQMQVTVSPRQHIRVDVGVREPLTDTNGRHSQVVFYVLWDWADGKFWEGW